MTRDDVLLSPAQAVKRFPFLTRSTLYGAFKDGLLPYYRLPSGKGKRGKYLVAEKDLLAWVDANRHEAETVKEDGPLTYL